jgi:hypothetical protein
MKIASHAFRSVAALLVLLTLIPASVAKLGDESQKKGVAPDEHGDDKQLDRELMITTSDHEKDANGLFSFTLEMETTDDSEHFKRILLKMMPIEWGDNYFEKFGEDVAFTFTLEDPSDRNLIAEEGVNSKRELRRRWRITGYGYPCRSSSGVRCTPQERDRTKPRHGHKRRMLELGNALQKFGDEMPKLFVDIDDVKVTLD